ncbi:uncharacterized protein LOC135928769 [Gordionus sp. m RMFG-2023]|uniref:uncharacterized protein LOC135928769 n=1 Tax=Gordionus sp. m RMFG-2023 TaxID=3053472 RepID=UPI0031FC6373
MKTPHLHENKISQSVLNKRRFSRIELKANLICKKIDNLNIKGALRLVSTHDSLAEPSMSTYLKLCQKHPLANIIPISPQPHSTCASLFTSEEVREAILSFHRDSAHGLDGIRPIFLQDITSPSTCSQTSVLPKLTNFCNKILNGEVPNFVSPILFGARLIALQKPNNDIRPIAMGSTFRRLVAKMISSRIKHDASRLLSPFQLGVGISGGCEAVVHLSRLYLENLPSNESLIKIDFSNAYNTLSRNSFLSSSSNLFPSYTKFFYSCYQQPSTLLFDTFKIPSVEDIQQGDPLGSLFFCLGINDIIKSINSVCSLSLHSWYIDDGILGGSNVEVNKAVNIIKEAGSAIGLSINPEKPEFIPINTIEPNTNKFKLTTLDGLYHLGAPVGGNSAISFFLQSTLDTLLELADLFSLLPSHKAFFLVKFFFNIPRILYALRSTAIFKFPILLGVYDNGIKILIENILNLKFDEIAWTQASLPTKMGGLGLRSPSDLTLTAFISSCLLTKNIINPKSLKPNSSFNDVIIEWRTRIYADHPLPESNKQKDWDRPIIALCVESLLSRMQLSDRPLFSSLLNGSGHVLEAIPSINLQLQLNKNELTHANGIRLNCLITQPHICSGCGSTVLGNGRHSIHCRSCKGRIVRHNLCNSIILRALRSAQIPSTLEPSGLYRSDEKRPDGISQIPWKRGQSLVWDYSCIDPLAPSNQTVNILEKKETLKIAKYSEISQEYIFIPIISTTLTTFG